MHTPQPTIVILLAGTLCSMFLFRSCIMMNVFVFSELEAPVMVMHTPQPTIVIILAVTLCTMFLLGICIMMNVFLCVFRTGVSSDGHAHTSTHNSYHPCWNSVHYVPAWHLHHDECLSLCFQNWSLQ